MLKLTIQTNDGVRQLQVRPGERILRAALSEGIDLPYDCATGTCGSCKVRLVAGRAEAEWPEAPGARRCGAGEILSCQGAALTDCTLAAPRLRPRQPGIPRPAAVNGVLRRCRPLAPEVVGFDVGLERPLEFAAGQFVLLETSHLPGARAYSIAGSSPGATDLSFVAKRKAGGKFTAWLFGASGAVDGAPVTMFGPLGRATYQPGERTPLICVAGGSGIGGMLSILRRAVEAGHLADARLFFGVRKRRDLFLLDELTALRSRHPDQLGITVALSDEEPAPDLAAQYPALSFRAGTVDAVLGQWLRGPVAGARAYLAGPRAMVDAAVRVLVQQGRLPPHEIRYDRFD